MSPAAQENNIITSGNGSNKFMKYALIGLGVITLIVAAELTFLYFNQTPQTTPVQEEVGEFRDRMVQQPSPTPPPISGRVTQQTPNINKIQNFAQTASLIEPGFTLSSSINLVIAGTVQSVSNQPREVGGVTYPFSITILNSEGQDLRISLTQGELSVSRVILKSSQGNQNISHSDIRQGDYVILRYVANLLDSSPTDVITFEVERNTAPGVPSQ